MSRLNRFEEVEGRKMDAEDVDKLSGPARLQYIEALSLQPFNPDELPNTFMYVSIAGFISSGTFKEPGFIKLDYEIVEGKDWDYVDVHRAHAGRESRPLAGRHAELHDGREDRLERRLQRAVPHT